MKKLKRYNFLMIINAVISCGTYDPTIIFCWFEERLFMHESDTIYEFLQWTYEGYGERNFDHDNYEEKFAEFLKSKLVKSSKVELPTNWEKDFL
jgi:hypothetical protein